MTQLLLNFKNIHQKNRHHEKTLILTALLATGANLCAQDFFGHNANQGLILVNPSFAGSNGLLRNQAGVSFRNPNFSQSLSTYYNVTDFYLKPFDAGIGIQLSSEDEAHGLYKRNTLGLVYAQHLQLGDRVLLVPAVQCAYVISRVDVNAVNFGSLLHGTVVWNNMGSIPISHRDFMDLSGSLLARFDRNFYAGVALYHFNRPEYAHFGNTRRPVRTSVYGSYTYHLSSSNLLQLQAHFQQEGDSWQSHFSGNMVFASRVIAGAGYYLASNQMFTEVMVKGGYRWDKFTVQLGAGSYITDLDLSSCEFGVSFNLRDREHRHALTAFEAM